MSGLGYCCGFQLQHKPEAIVATKAIFSNLNQRIATGYHKCDVCSLAGTGFSQIILTVYKVCIYLFEDEQYQIVCAEASQVFKGSGHYYQHKTWGQVDSIKHCDKRLPLK